MSRLNHVSLSLPEKKETLDWLKSINVEINYQELNFLEDVNIIDLSSDLIIQARQEIDDFSSDLAKCNSSKKIEKIAAKWEDSNLLKKLNWLSKIIRNSIFLKMSEGPENRGPNNQAGTPQGKGRRMNSGTGYQAGNNAVVPRGGFGKRRN